MTAQIFEVCCRWKTFVFLAKTEVLALALVRLRCMSAPRVQLVALKAEAPLTLPPERRNSARTAAKDCSTASRRCDIDAPRHRTAALLASPIGQQER